MLHKIFSLFSTKTEVENFGGCQAGPAHVLDCAQFLLPVKELSQLGVEEPIGPSVSVVAGLGIMGVDHGTAVELLVQFDLDLVVANCMRATGGTEGSPMRFPLHQQPKTTS
jgi:hypothetical protein